MIRIRTVLTGVAGSPYYQNLFFLGTTESQASSAFAVVAGAWDFLEDSLRAGMVANTENSVPRINVATGQIEEEFTITGDGQTIFTNTAQVLPPATQMCLRLNTAGIANGRRVKGRSFIPGFCENQNEQDGTPNATVAAAVAAAFSTALGGSNSLAVYSKKNAQVFPVTGVSAMPQWSVLRSRRD